MAEDQEGLVEQETPDVIEDNKDANAIASMLWVWKWVNRERLKYENYSDNLYIRLAPGDIKPWTKVRHKVSLTRHKLQKYI